MGILSNKSSEPEVSLNDRLKSAAAKRYATKEQEAINAQRHRESAAASDARSARAEEEATAIQKAFTILDEAGVTV